MVLECDSAIQEEFDAFDNWMIDYLSEHSERLLKRKMTPDQVVLGYCSCIKPAPLGKNFNPTLKTKNDQAGVIALRCWSTNGDAAIIPDQWRWLRVKPRMHFSHLWIMGQQFGVVLKVTDAELAGEGVEEHVIVTNPFR